MSRGSKQASSLLIVATAAVITFSSAATSAADRPLRAGNGPGPVANGPGPGSSRGSVLKPGHGWYGLAKRRQMCPSSRLCSAPYPSGKDDMLARKPTGRQPREQ